MELFSVFLAPPLFAVHHGRQELGFVDELTFLSKQEGSRTLLLGGRAWRVTHIDWQRRVAHVEPSEDKGRSRWKGTGQVLGFPLCQAIKRVLADDESRPCWSQRAQDQIRQLRDDFSWLTPEGSVVIANKSGDHEWWTFAGQRVNGCLAPALSQATKSQATFDSFALHFQQHVSMRDVEKAIDQIRSGSAAELMPAVDERAVQGLKFSECLPTEMAMRVLQMRARDEDATRHVLRDPVGFVSW
jgi:ATP-dependent Lhr-like helicase